MILVGGFDVSPNEVEDIVAQLPGVLACAAVGIPDARAGEAVKLIVVKADPASPNPSEADIRAWCEARLTGYKRPRIVEFRADLPRTPVGQGAAAGAARPGLSRVADPSRTSGAAVAPGRRAAPIRRVRADAKLALAVEATLGA